MTSYASFDPTQGFAITNNTDQNVYLQTSATAFETIEAGEMSTVQTASGNYNLRVNKTTNAAVYLTVKVSSGDGSVTASPGAQRGKFVVTTNFA